MKFGFLFFELLLIDLLILLGSDIRERSLLLLILDCILPGREMSFGFARGEAFQQHLNFIQVSISILSIRVVSEWECKVVILKLRLQDRLGWCYLDLS